MTKDVTVLAYLLTSLGSIYTLEFDLREKISGNPVDLVKLTITPTKRTLIRTL